MSTKQRPEKPKPSTGHVYRDGDPVTAVCFFLTVVIFGVLLMVVAFVRAREAWIKDHAKTTVEERATE